ncbi:MAG: hypothetical protein CL885_03870, partial [Dehalococcoidia bacterium]|nr:hypothetical protein [Dehalococcoidia bacterium]
MKNNKIKKEELLKRFNLKDLKSVPSLEKLMKMGSPAEAWLLNDLSQYVPGALAQQEAIWRNVGLTHKRASGIEEITTPGGIERGRYGYLLEKAKTTWPKFKKTGDPLDLELGEFEMGVELDMVLNDPEFRDLWFDEGGSSKFLKDPTGTLAGIDKELGKGTVAPLASFIQDLQDIGKTNKDTGTDGYTDLHNQFTDLYNTSIAKLLQERMSHMASIGIRNIQKEKGDGSFSPLASGFIPNFAPSGGINASRFFNADYDAPALSRALNTESAMGAKKPVVDRHPSVGTYVRDAATQPNFAAVRRDHPEGLNQAVENSRAIQSAAAAKGFLPNFSVNSDLYYPFQFEEGLKEYERLKKEFGGGTEGAKALTKVSPTSGFRHTLWESAFYKRNVPELYNRNPIVSESFFGGKDDLFGADERMEAWASKFDRLLKAIDNHGSRHGLFHTQLPSNIDFDGEYSGKEYRTREEGFTISKHFSGKGSVIDPTTGERSEYVDNLTHTTRLGADMANELDSAVINDLESVLRTYDIENYREQTSDLEPESAIARRAQDAEFRAAMRKRITAWRDKYQEEASASVLQSRGNFSLIENLKWNAADDWARVIGGKKYKDRERFLILGNSTNLDIIKGVIDKKAIKNTEAIKALTDRNRKPSSSPYYTLTKKFDDFSAFNSIRDESIGELEKFMEMKYSQSEWGSVISEIAKQDKFKKSWRAALVMKARYSEDPSVSVKSFAEAAQKNSDILDKVWGIGSGKEG